MKRTLGRKLVLTRETVLELTDVQLKGVAGGQTRPGHICFDTYDGGVCPSGVGPSLTGMSCVCPTCGPSCNPGCCG